MAAPVADQETIVREMRDRIQDWNWEGATMASVVRAARVAFEPEFRSRSDLAEVRNFFYWETKVCSNPAFLGTMMSIYLGSYEPGASHTKSLAVALDGPPPSRPRNRLQRTLGIKRNEGTGGQASARLGARWSRLLVRVPQLLHPVQAGMAIGRMMRGMDDPWTGLKELGFQNPHAPGLLHHAHLAYVAEMEPALRTQAGASRMLAWLKPPGRDARRGGAPEALNALLSPWISFNPPEELRNQLIGELVSAYGDPRARSGGGGVWASVGDRQRQVILRWLTGANIRFFLDVVTEVEESHMWQPRREFWWGLYEEGRIDEAWVAFSPVAAAAAKRMAQFGEAPSMLEYGKQIAGGSRRDTSLLILKVGECIVVEGSHNYKVHVFRSDDPRAPSLFRKAYDCEEIRLAPGHREQAHHAGWEDRVRRLIDYWS